MIRIRKATRSDLIKIVDFQCAMALETEDLQLDKNTVHLGVVNAHQDPSKGIYYVACENDLVIGSLLITKEWSDWRNGEVWWIQSLYVIPKYRRKGVFKSMYEHLTAIVTQTDDIKGLRLYVDKSNQTAQKVYDALGMDAQHYKMYEWMK